MKFDIEFSDVLKAIGIAVIGTLVILGIISLLA